MAAEAENRDKLTDQLALGAILTEIAGFLTGKYALGEMQQMDVEVAEAITPEEFDRYNCYKQFCLNELAEKNKTPGLNGSLRAAIERGFIIGYWFALQHQKEA